MAIRILLVDDQPMVRQGLRMFLSLDADLEVIGEARNGYEAVNFATRLKPDVILMDLMMPQLNGIEATDLLRIYDRATTIIALSISEDPALIEAVIRAGANAYFSKGVETEKLITMIKGLVRL